MLSLALCTCAPAQTSEPVANDELINVRTDFVTVPFVVTDAHGARVPALAQTDFAALIDGQPVPINYFAPGAAHVALLFALDASGSIAANIARQRETALALCARFGHDSTVGVLTFTAQPRMTLPFTNDLAQARAAFQLDALSNQHTAIFDAARAAVRAFDDSKIPNSNRRIVVLISDGLDTVSTTLPATVIDEANARGVTFYVIHLPLYAPADGALVVRRPTRGFRELGARTGGKYFLVGDAHTALDPHAAAADLAPVFNTIAADLQSQYVLGLYPPTDARAGYHRVEVTLKQQGGRKLRVRQLRAGYMVIR
jgi:Ca-activated chloride channel homolog